MLPVRIAAELARVARDRFATRSAVPRDVRAITAHWLSEVLGASVAAFEIVEETAGTTERARLRLEGDGVPRSVFVKLAPAAIPTRLFVNLMRLGFDEAGFYRNIRPHLPIDAPLAFAVREDRRLGRFALVLEDLAARGCRFADVRTSPTLDEAFAIVTALARLHGAFWESPRFEGDLAWVRSHAGDPNATVVAVLLRAAFRRLRRRELVPAGASLLIERRAEIELALATGPASLLHGDPHYGNLYFDADAPGFLDWQVIRRGPSLRDLAYFMVLSLDTDMRRAHQEELLRHYLGQLAASGGAASDFDEAWRRYRQEATYPWVAAVFTAAAGGFQAEEIAGVGLRRATAALDDLDTVAEIRSLLDRPTAG